MSSETIPGSLDEISAAWLDARLPASLTGGARVVGVSGEPIGAGEGFAGTLARLTVITDPPAAVGPLIAKFASAHGTTRELLVQMGGYEKEVRFYSELAVQAPMSTPACYIAEYDAAAGAFVLVFEDLAPAVVGDQVTGASLAQAEQVVDALALLHARWWNRVELLDRSWLLPPPGFAQRLRELIDEGRESVRAGWSDRYPELVALTETAGRLLPLLIEQFGDGPPPRPFSLVHGDVRLDNIFFPSEGGGRFAVIDWQGAAVGSPANDLAYWLVLSLPVETRRRHEDALLRRYHAGLLSRGVRGYSLASLRRAYRNGAVLLLGGAPVLVANLDLTSSRGTALVNAGAERLDAAVRDWHAERTLRMLPWLLRGMGAWEAAKRPFARIGRTVSRRRV